MRPFFHNSSRHVALAEALRRWEGTPYVPGTAVCGAGGDCVRTADAICRETGWSRVLTWPRYATTGEDAARLVACLDEVAELARVPDGDAWLPGDAIAAKSRRSGNPHLALYEGNEYLWHMSSVGRRGGWVRRHVDVARRAWELLAVYRPMEVEH